MRTVPSESEVNGDPIADPPRRARVVPSGRSASSSQPGSLLIMLNRVRRSNSRLVGILPRTSTRAALTKEIPTLVQSDLDGPQTILVLCRECIPGVHPLETMLLIRQLTDVTHDLEVVHDVILADAGTRPDRSSGIRHIPRPSPATLLAA